MKWAAAFVCAALSMSCASAIRQDDDEVDNLKVTGLVGAADGFEALESGKWCDHKHVQTALVTEEGYNLEKCQKACTDEASCNYACFDANADWCATYPECGTLTDHPHDFKQDSSGWTCYKKVATEENDEQATVLDKHEQEERDSEFKEEEVTLPECECAQDKYESGSNPGDKMCSFQGGRNCALSKGSCPEAATACTRPESEHKPDELAGEASEMHDLPDCTCEEDKYQSGSNPGDTMCSFQGGKNCALSKGSCPEVATTCKRPESKAEEKVVEDDESHDLPECTCEEDKYQSGSNPGDTMCSFQGGKNCALSKGSCPEAATACTRPESQHKPDELAGEASELHDLPDCTCEEDKYQSGSNSGDTMCSFQGGKNCALSKGSCPEVATACKKP